MFKERFGFFDKSLLVGVIVFSFGLHVFFQNLELDVRISGVSLITILSQQLLAIAVVILVVKFNIIGRVSVDLLPVLLLYFCWMLSLLTSDKPLLVVANVGAAFLLVVYGYCIGRFSLGWFVRVLDYLFFVHAILFVFYLIGAGDFFVYHDPLGRLNLFGGQIFVGLLSHKLAAGLFCAVYLMRVVSIGYESSLLKQAVFVLALLFLVLSDSVTYLISFFVAFIAVGFWKRGWLLIKLIPIAVVLLYFGYGLLEVLLVLLGRDIDFTGRMPLWEIAIQTFVDRPIFGYGFRAFFSEDLFEMPEIFIWLTNGIYTGSFENAIIGTFVETGVVGGIAFIVYIFHLLMFMDTMVSRDAVHPVFLVGCILIFLISSFSLSGFMLPLSITTLVVGVLYGVSACERK